MAHNKIRAVPTNITMVSRPPAWIELVALSESVAASARSATADACSVLCQHYGGRSAVQLVKLSDLNLSYNRLERIAASLFSSIPSPPLRFRSSVSYRSGSACALPQHEVHSLHKPPARLPSAQRILHRVTGSVGTCAASYAARCIVCACSMNVLYALNLRSNALTVLPFDIVSMTAVQVWPRRPSDVPTHDLP